MNSSRLSRRVVLWFTGGVLAVQAAAQTFTLSSTDFTTNLSLLGQAFTASVAGPQGTGSSGAGSTVYLQSFQFNYADTNYASTLRIYSSLPALTADIVSGGGAGLVGSSLSQSSGTYTFSNLALDRTTQYYALLTAAGTIRGTVLSDPYAGGDTVGISGLAPLTLGAQDSAFTATFSQAAIPEPATTAAAVGLVALAVVMIRRRGRGPGPAPSGLR